MVENQQLETRNSLLNALIHVPPLCSHSLLSDSSTLPPTYLSRLTVPGLLIFTSGLIAHCRLVSNSCPSTV